MADPKATSTSQSVESIVNALSRYLPQYGEVTRGQILPTEQARLEASKAVSPEYAALQNQLAEQYLPGLAKAYSNAGVGADVNALQTYGQQLQSAASASEDPAQKAARVSSLSKLGELLGSINLNDANPEAERLVSQESLRSGNAYTPSAQETTANALSFGKEMDKRRASLGSALQTAAGLLPNTGSFNAANAIVGRGQQGASQFGGVQQAGNQGYGQASELLGSASALKQQQNQINSERASGIDWLNAFTPDSISA